MDEARHIIVYGRTLILGTVEASLRRFPQVRLSVLSAPFPTAGELEAMVPDAIVFDLSAPLPDSALALLQRRPGLMLIGVDPSSDGSMVLSSRPALVLSASDLVNVIYHEDLAKANGREADESTMQFYEEDLHRAMRAARDTAMGAAQP